jgi:transcriptional regulator with XRE-family HTH domain
MAMSSGSVSEHRHARPDAVALGALVRDLRLAHGWSQGRLAGALEAASGVPLGREYVSRWEHGRRRPGRFWLRHLATVLQVPLAVLEEGARVDRRTFLTGIAAGAIAPAVASDLIGHGFSAALRARPSAEAWRWKLAAYGRDYMTAGAAEVQRRLAADLVVLQQQLDTPVMWDVASRLMVLYGKTFPGSDGARAANWYWLAAEAADRGGDLRTRVWVRGRAAIALGYEGAALPVAQTFADQALALDPSPSLGALNAIMGKAHAAALSGDSKAARELLARGRRVFDAAGSGDGEESDYAVPWWRMNVFTSLLAARLGDEPLAVQAQDAAAASLPASMPRFVTHLELHRALMLARAGDQAGGAAYARAAMAALPPEKHSLTLRLLAAEVEGHQPGH